MVERVRGWSKLVAGLVMQSTAWLVQPQLSIDDQTDEECATALHEKQLTQIAPPPREFHPMMHDPWPWFDDETGETDWEIVPRPVRDVAVRERRVMRTRKIPVELLSILPTPSMD